MATMCLRIGTTTLRALATSSTVCLNIGWRSIKLMVIAWTWHMDYAEKTVTTMATNTYLKIITKTVWKQCRKTHTSSLSIGIVGVSKQHSSIRAWCVGTIQLTPISNLLWDGTMVRQVVLSPMPIVTTMYRMPKVMMKNVVVTKQCSMAMVLWRPIRQHVSVV